MTYGSNLSLLSVGVCEHLILHLLLWFTGYLFLTTDIALGHTMVTEAMFTLPHPSAGLVKVKQFMLQILYTSLCKANRERNNWSHKCDRGEKIGNKKKLLSCCPVNVKMLSKNKISQSILLSYSTYSHGMWMWLHPGNLGMLKTEETFSLLKETISLSPFSFL